MPIKSKDLIRIVLQHKYVMVSQKWSHIKYRKGTDKTILIPNHKDLKPWTARSIVVDFCQQNGIVVEDFIKDHNLKF